MKREEGQFVRMTDEDLDFAALKLFDYNGNLIRTYVRENGQLKEVDEKGLTKWFSDLYDAKMEADLKKPE